MMEIVLPRSWKEEFDRAAQAKRADRLEREKLAAFDLLERERHEKRQEKEKREEAETRALIAEALASPAQIVEFRIQLDGYEAATVEALMRNQEALDAVRRQADEMLEKAHVLPDGRRVFRTRDGHRVFDEHGHQVGPEDIHPTAIDMRKPLWEDFGAVRQEGRRLEEERQQLLRYQQRLDDARERLNRGDLTQAELERMKGELGAAMPDVVRQRLGMEQREQQAAAPQLSSPQAPLPDTMDALMRETGLGPRAAAP